jgi:HEPN domain-containing protein
MEERGINYSKIFEHWLTTADQDFITMNNLYKSGDYHWSLFIGHLVIEKLIKAAFVKKKQSHAPFSHDLRKLALEAGLEFPEDMMSWLDTITAFNINARYDTYKQAFYRKCTPDYTKEWVEKIFSIREWIRTRL